MEDRAAADSCPPTTAAARNNLELARAGWDATLYGSGFLRVTFDPQTGTSSYERIPPESVQVRQ